MYLKRIFLSYRPGLFSGAFNAFLHLYRCIIFILYLIIFSSAAVIHRRYLSWANRSCRIICDLLYEIRGNDYWCAFAQSVLLSHREQSTRDKRQPRPLLERMNDGLTGVYNWAPRRIISMARLGSVLYDYY